MYPEESRKAGSEKEKKGKKSWKSSLTSWWKSDSKSKHGEKTTKNSKPMGGSGKRHAHSSGPMYKSCKSSDGKHWRPSSGPLVSLFKPTKREENEIPYISLQQQNNSPLADQNYGPLYVVTWLVCDHWHSCRLWWHKLHWERLSNLFGCLENFAGQSSRKTLRRRILCFWFWMSCICSLLDLIVDKGSSK